MLRVAYIYANSPFVNVDDGAAAEAYWKRIRIFHFRT